jgi:hypothetical protein
MKVGRNEACPCGSGKKHKQCCGTAPATEPPHRITRRRLRRAVEELTPKLKNFTTESYGPNAILEAWEEFTLWSGEPFSADSPHATLFYPWFFHIWSPEPPDTAVTARCLQSVPPTQAYLIAQGAEEPLSRYLSACLDSPFTFHEILSTEPGPGLRLRDVLTDRTCEVLEGGAAGSLKPGDILYGMVVECDGIAMLEASAPLALPPRFKQTLLQEREALLDQERLDRRLDEEAAEAYADAVEASEARAGEDDALEEGISHDAAGTLDEPGTPVAAASPGDGEDAAPGGTPDAQVLNTLSLLKYDFSNRELYWELVETLLQPVPSLLHNSDGEPVSRQRLVFTVDSATAAFAALKALSLADPDDLKTRSCYADDGTLERVEFTWDRRGEREDSAGTVVLGRLRIDGTRLTADVDSGERGREFKRIARELLGDGGRYLMTEVA